ncbi:hypothetical protein AVEN_260411-1 [Araneus ventricosus]|uniref:Uncharacterized protein n=1 Tax=Araneus ventricosus TaxID=182803 RepID=A0A4Y2KJZ0_ARAVE|nr:hypothetical protein AVEN_260411-1 [Araneus ventricosus]
MGSAEGSELLSDCKDLLRQGVSDRNNEIYQMKNDSESWSSESEVLQVVTICEKYLKSCLEKRQLETQKVQELLNLLEEESNNVAFARSFPQAFRKQIFHHIHGLSRPGHQYVGFYLFKHERSNMNYEYSI